MHVSKLGMRLWKVVAITGLALVLTLVTFGPGTLAVETTYGGRAYGVGTSRWLGETRFADTGGLSTTGGVLVADFAPVDTEVADATVFLSYTRGFSDLAMSEVVASDVVLLAGTAFQVVADFAYAKASATCWDATGASQIAGLTVGGVWVGVTGEPNQVYEVPGVFRLVINEQIDSSYGGVQSIIVNALHAWIYGVDVVVSSASSQVSCGSTGGSLLNLALRVLSLGVQCGDECDKHPQDFVTGGGWFDPANSASCCFQSGRVNFGFNAGSRPGNPEVKGHLNAINHATRIHLKGTNVDNYERWFNDGEHCRTFAGNAAWNGNSGRYRAWVCDYGEPGRDDRFAVKAWASGKTEADPPDLYWDNDSPTKAQERGDLDGGNIQLHLNPRA